MAAIVAMTSVKMVVGWQLYSVTSNPLYLGLAGVIMFAPSILLMFVSGLMIDRFDRRHVLVGSYIILTSASLILCVLALTDNLEPIGILCAVALFGVGRAFYIPTIKSLLANLVAGRALPQAIALNSSLGKLAVVCGPILGGFLFTLSPALSFAVAAGVFLFSATTATRLRGSTQIRPTSPGKASDFLEGIWALRRDKALLHTVLLHSMVIFSGTVTAMLPVFAKDVLGTDAAGLGLLRSGTALGGILMAASLARYPLQRKAGATMIAAVSVYAFSIIFLGFSSSFLVAYIALMVSGTMDMISFNVRESLVQLRTEDQFRGRVTTANSVANNAAQEIGDFRAAFFATLMGAGPTMVLGGLVALGCALSWYKYSPQLRRIDRLE